MPLFSASGEFDGSLALIEDASEQQQAAGELATARAIIENSSMVIYRARLEEGLPIEFVSGNVAYFGYLTESLTSGLVGFTDLLHADDARRVLDERRGTSLRAIASSRSTTVSGPVAARHCGSRTGPTCARPPTARATA